MRHTSKAPKISPPYLSVVGEDEDGDPILMLTVDADALIVCAHCPRLHVRVMNLPGTSAAIRHFATSLRQWADRMDDLP